MVSYIFLFGHRKQHGKDFSCDLLETELRKRGLQYIRTSFAKKLKKQCADRYNLDFERMETDIYKNSKPEHLNGLSVRDVLIKEGNFARSIWGESWTSSAYNEIFEDVNADVGLISDYRYPNEGIFFDNAFKNYQSKKPFLLHTKPTLVRILVNRENGVYTKDGADDQLPDSGLEYWDEVIHNNIEGGVWKENLRNQIDVILKKHIDYSEPKGMFPCRINS